MKSHKSKHKHDYEDCLLINKDLKEEYCIVYGKGKYCKICGKISNIKFNFIESEEIKNKKYIKLKKEYIDKKLFEKYKNIKKFYVPNVFNKYIVIDERDYNEE